MNLTELMNTRLDGNQIRELLESFDFFIDNYQYKDENEAYIYFEKDQSNGKLLEVEKDITLFELIQQIATINYSLGIDEGTNKMRENIKKVVDSANLLIELSKQTK